MISDRFSVLRVGHSRRTTSASRAPIRGAAVAADGEHVGVFERLAGEPGREVGDQREGQHLGALRARGDRLVDRRHADEVGTEGLQRPDLRRGLELRPRHDTRRPPPRASGSTLRASSREPAAVALGEVDEPRPDERGASGQVQVVGDQHRLADRRVPRAGRRRHSSARRPSRRRRRRCARRARPPRGRGPRTRARGRGRRAPGGRRRRSSAPALLCPITPGGGKAAEVGEVERRPPDVPSRSAAGSHPEPSTIAMSCRVAPDSSARRAADACASGAFSPRSALLMRRSWHGARGPAPVVVRDLHVVVEAAADELAGDDVGRPGPARRPRPREAARRGSCWPGSPRGDG